MIKTTETVSVIRDTVHPSLVIGLLKAARESEVCKLIGY